MQFKRYCQEYLKDEAIIEAKAKAPNLRFEGPRNSNSPFWRKNFGTGASYSSRILKDFLYLKQVTLFLRKTPYLYCLMYNIVIIYMAI